MQPDLSGAYHASSMVLAAAGVRQLAAQEFDLDPELASLEVRIDRTGHVFVVYIGPRGIQTGEVTL